MCKRWPARWGCAWTCWRLRCKDERAPAGFEEPEAAWHASTEAYRQAVEKGKGMGEEMLAEQFYVLITCRDDAHQREMLARFREEGLECRAILG